MNENEFDRTARAWLDEGPTRMSDRALLSALEEIHTTRQRRALWPAWRATPVSIFARVATATVLVVAVGLLAINVVPRQPDGSSVGGRSSSPSPAQVVDFPDLTTAFVSPRNGFSVKHPNGAALTPAKQLWGFGKQVDDGFDVLETGLAAAFKGASTINGGEDSTYERADQYLSRTNQDLSGGCGAPSSEQAEITIDGHSGRIAECANRVEASVVAGGRLYLFILEHDRSDARAVFEAFVATIDLRPETAVDFPGLTETFVSPTYGYSFKHPHRVAPELAKELWDPVNQPSPVDDLGGSAAEYLDEFDVVETGLGYVFISASTQIPDGVSIDEWIDEAVIKYLPAGCYVPRRQQAPITIDGRSGRIWEDCTDIVATVVVDGRLYLFMMAHGEDRDDDARAFFDAFAATIDLRPGDAAVPSSTPSS